MSLTCFIYHLIGITSGKRFFILLLQTTSGRFLLMQKASLVDHVDCCEPHRTVRSTRHAGSPARLQVETFSTHAVSRSGALLVRAWGETGALLIERGWTENCTQNSSRQTRMRTLYLSSSMAFRLPENPTCRMTLTCL